MGKVVSEILDPLADANLGKAADTAMKAVVNAAGGK